jgi:glycosyltransferase involved in cell wall biosynthesis
MRVLLVVGHATGGMGAHVTDLARGLAERGHEVRVWTSPGTTSAFALEDVAVPDWPAGLRCSETRALRSLRAYVRSADVVHAHGHQAGLLSVLAARSLRRPPPVVVSWHNAVLGSGPARRVKELAERVQTRGADLITGASDDLVARAARLGARGAVLTPVAARRHDAGCARVVDPDRPTVLTVSRIAPQKRLDVLVGAAARVGARVPDVRWLVAGDGNPELLAALQTRTADAAAPVTWLGRRDDVPDLLTQADVFVLTSDWEARALVVQEAMAAGVPVVATEVGGLPGLLGGAGLLVPPGDPGAVADAVLLVLTQDGLAERLSAAGRERAAGLPGPDDVLTDWVERYARLTRSGRPGRG